MILLTELQIAKNDRDGKVALAAAKAGVEASINALQSNGSWAAGFSNQAGPSGSGYSYTVTVENVYPFVVLTSVGQPGGALSKTVRATCMVAGSPNTAPYRVRLDKWEEL